MNFDELKRRLGRPDEIRSNWEHVKNDDGTRGGWIKCTVGVQHGCHIGPNAIVEGTSNIGEGSRIEDNAHIVDAKVSNSVIGGNSLLVRGEYAGQTLRDVTAFNGEIASHPDTVIRLGPREYRP